MVLCRAYAPLTGIICLPYCVIIFGLAFDMTLPILASAVEWHSADVLYHSLHFKLYDDENCTLRFLGETFIDIPGCR